MSVGYLKHSLSIYLDISGNIVCRAGPLNPCMSRTLDNKNAEFLSTICLNRNVDLMQLWRSVCCSKIEIELLLPACWKSNRRLRGYGIVIGRHMFPRKVKSCLQQERFRK